MEDWYIYAGGENILIVKNSHLADNILSSEKAKIFYENVTIVVIRARDEVEITVKDSKVYGDVIAEDNSKIAVIDTKVNGNIIEKENGKIIVE